MSADLDAFRTAYRDAFVSHLRAGGETGLVAAYELGRTAMLGKLSVLDLATIHHDVLFDALGQAADPELLRAATDATANFFLELLSTYEMIHRGYAEAHETARVEQQHAEQLRRLADASLVISAAGTVDEIVRRTAEHAARVLGAAWAAVTVRTSPHADLEHVYPPDRSVTPAGDAPVEVPLQRRDGSVVGGVRAGSDWPFSANDEAILTQLARVAGVALENAELYEQQRLVAETLQRRLLPGGLPSFPGVTMAWRYLPGWRGSDIGGDWYDAAVVPGGRLALVVGDVMGKGIQAAAGMGQLRVALRAYAIEGHPPGEVIRRLDQVVEELEEELATAVYLVFDPADETLRYANAGHPPPLLIGPDGEVRTLTDGLAPPLGSILGSQISEGAVRVVPGSTLVAYTDGLIERRGADIEHGINRLRAVAAAGDTSDLDGFCELLLAGMDVGTRADDIALLAVRWTATP
jgi:hypothetical protein